MSQSFSAVRISEDGRKQADSVFSTDSCNSKTRSDSIKQSVSEDYCINTRESKIKMTV